MESESERTQGSPKVKRDTVFFDKYKLIFVSLEIFSMGERRRPSIIKEPCDQNLPMYSETSNPSPSIACRFQRFFSVVTLDFLALAIRVANALRKLRYHQLCSPASLPTEWTQSGSLSSESSFRWFPSYVRTLLPTGKWRINRHATSPSIVLSRIFRLSQHGILYCFLPNAPRDVFLSIELNILSYYIIFRLHENWILARAREWEL